MDKKDPILEFGQYIGCNFDVGHYFAGTKGLSPIPVIGLERSWLHRSVRAGVVYRTGGKTILLRCSY